MINTWDVLDGSVKDVNDSPKSSLEVLNAACESMNRQLQDKFVSRVGKVFHFKDL